MVKRLSVYSILVLSLIFYGKVSYAQTDCNTDAVTVESLRAAQLAINQGVTDVSLSPGGCFRYVSVVTDGKIIQEWVLFAGKLVTYWDHSQTQQSVGLWDGDRNGVADRRTSVMRDPSGSTQSVTIEEWDQTTFALAYRRTMTVTNPTVMHVVVEQANESQKLVKVAEYDIPTSQPQGSADRDISKVPFSQYLSVPCPPGLKDQVMWRLLEAGAEGNTCLRSHFMYAQAASIAEIAAKGEWQFSIICKKGGDYVAGTAGTDLKDSSDPLKAMPLYIFIDNWPTQSRDQQSTMFHELLHRVLPDWHHEPMFETLLTNRPLYTEYDRVEACENLCFSPKPTRCQCSTCLNKKTCEPPCSGLEPCANTEPAALCPCANQVYPFSQCTAECRDYKPPQQDVRWDRIVYKICTIGSRQCKILPIPCID